MRLPELLEQYLKALAKFEGQYKAAAIQFHKTPPRGSFRLVFHTGTTAVCIHSKNIGWIIEIERPVKGDIDINVYDGITDPIEFLVNQLGPMRGALKQSTTENIPRSL